MNSRTDGNSTTQESAADRIAHPDYEKLPACIKHTVTEREYAWMDDYMRGKLIETETTPDWTE